MQLGRVVGTVVARQRVDGLDGKKLLILEPLTHELVSAGPNLVAVDTVQAGSGDLVFWVGSREASLALKPWFVPVDAAVIGIVDAIP